MKKYGIKIKCIVKCNDKFLIVKKWYDDRIEDPYQWEFLDTDLEDGETPEVTCLRHVQESIGIDAHILCMPYTWTYMLGDSNFLGISFLCRVEEEPVILSEALTDYRWVGAEELPEYISNSFVINDMREAGVI